MGIGQARQERGTENQQGLDRIGFPLQNGPRRFHELCGMECVTEIGIPVRTDRFHPLGRLQPIRAGAAAGIR